MSKLETKSKENPKKEENNKEINPLKQHYAEMLSKCISVESSSESADARYKLNQLDQQLRVMGLRATIKIGIEKI